MKILMMTNTYTPLVGGLEQSIQSFSDEFRKMGHDVLIVAPTFEGQPKREHDVVRVPSIKKVNKTQFSVHLPVPGFLEELIRKFPADIVHSHHPFLMGDLALRLSRQCRIPIVFTHHIMFEQYAHYLPIQNETTKRFVVEIATGYANLVDQVIAPSESVREALLSYGVTNPITVVPTGIDLNRFKDGDGKSFRKRHKIPANAFVIGHVARLAAEKNLDFLVKGLLTFFSKAANVYILLVGDGPSREAVIQEFTQAGFKNRLCLTGFLKGQDLIDAYFAMDVFGFASLSETQGMALLEAMAAGVPVVAVDAPGVREVVNDRLNGRLMKTCDQGEFVEALLWCLKCPSEKWRKIKQEAKKTARSFSIRVCAKRMLKIYDDLRIKEFVSSESKDNPWYGLVERLKIEWGIFKNLVEASEAAIFERPAYKRKRRLSRKHAIHTQRIKSE